MCGSREALVPTLRAVLAITDVSESVVLEEMCVLLELYITNSTAVSYFYSKMHISSILQSFWLVIRFIKINNMTLKVTFLQKVI